jgi:hypothetical protein
MNYCASHSVFIAEAYKGKKSYEKYGNIFCTPLLGVSVLSKITIHSIIKQSLTGFFVTKARARSVCSFRCNISESESTPTKIFVARVQLCDWFCDEVKSDTVNPLLSSFKQETT